MSSIRVTSDDLSKTVELVLHTARSTEDVFWIKSLDPETLEQTGLELSGNLTNVIDQLRGLENTYIDYLA